ncbi:hypothetical protein EDB84DRAFT_1443792 [Lactarius hengduanensis]|nr:hypothetical protein EDB84DRAFT_1443792 [Lactarius hengduanensis]
MDGVHMVSLFLLLSLSATSLCTGGKNIFPPVYVASFPPKITYPSQADVMDGVHMILGLVPTEDHLSILADVTDGVQQPFHSFHEKTIALGWNFNDCGFIERDCVMFIDCHFVVVELVPLDHPSANLRRERPTSLVMPRRATLSFPCASHPRKLQIMFVIVTTSLASLAPPSSPGHTPRMDDHQAAHFPLYLLPLYPSLLRHDNEKNNTLEYWIETIETAE